MFNVIQTLLLAASAVHGAKVVTKCVVPGMVALTYDDGVSTYTPKLLEMLKSEGVRATFFVLGRNLDADRSLTKSVLKRMWKAGHDIGSHTYNHESITGMSTAEMKSEMDRTDAIIGDALGVTPLFMRPPYGTISDYSVNEMTKLGYMVVNWNIDSDDWTMEWSAPSVIAQHVCSKIPRMGQGESSYIILYHDTVKSSVDAQREIIRDLKKKGYKFGNMSECLGNASLYQDY